MAYFVNHPGPEPRKTGLAMPRRQLSPSRLTRGPNRDVLIQHEVEAMSARESENFLLKKLDRSEAPLRGKQMGPSSARQKHSEIFATPKPNTPPRLRIKPQMDLPQLEKLVVRDTKKDVTAANMAAKPTLIDQMYACQYPQPHAQELYRPQKKLLELPVPKSDEAEPAGFAGMGHFSHMPRKTGIGMKAPEAYEPLPMMRRKPIAPRHRNMSVYNPVNGERNPFYGDQAHEHEHEPGQKVSRRGSVQGHRE